MHYISTELKQITMKKKPLHCLFTDVSCTETIDNTLIKSCSECKHYNNGVMLKGPTPILHELNSYFNKIINK